MAVLAVDVVASGVVAVGASDVVVAVWAAFVDVGLCTDEVEADCGVVVAAGLVAVCDAVVPGVLDVVNSTTVCGVLRFLDSSTDSTQQSLGHDVVEFSFHMTNDLQTIGDESGFASIV